MEVFVYFEDLEDKELFSPKHSRSNANLLVPETAVQYSTLQDTTDSIWTSLLFLGAATDLQALNLPYIDTKEKQDALVAAMRTTLTKDFLMNHIRLKWPVFVEERRRRKKNHKTASQMEAERRAGCF